MQGDLGTLGSGEHGLLGPRLELSAYQRELWEALNDRNYKLGEFYLDAITIIRYEELPLRFMFAAHGLREMMDDLPKYLEVQTQTLGKDVLNNKVRDMSQRWRNLLAHTECHRDGKWEGTIDQRLGDFLNRTGTFYTEFDENDRKRDRDTHLILRELDSRGGRLPMVVLTPHVDQWKKLRDYFVARAHDSSEIVAREFEGRLSALETFLLERMRPRTLADLSELDKIIAEGEQDA